MGSGVLVAIRASSGNSGFTLIELMVTLAVLAILAAIAAPSFADIIDKFRLRGAVDDVVSVIANARAESVKSGLDVRVDFAGTTGAWCVAANPAVVPTAGERIDTAADCDCSASTSTCIAMPNENLLSVPVGSHTGVTVTPATVGKAFTFNSKLGVVSPLVTHSVTLISPAGKYFLAATVNPLGQASVCVPIGKPVIAGVSSC